MDEPSTTKRLVTSNFHVLVASTHHFVPLDPDTVTVHTTDTSIVAHFIDE
jgi:hypothetical protein